MGKSKFDPRPFAEQLIRNHKLVYDKYHRLWMYIPETGLWQDNAEIILEKILRKSILPDSGQKSFTFKIREILADVKALRYQDGEFPEPPWHLIPFKNGFYDLKEGKFQEYTSGVGFTSKLAVNYNEHATCPYIDEKFAQLQPSNRVIDLYELVAYSMVRQYPYQKVFFLYGSGANGKSVFASVLGKLVGRRNMSHVSLTNFQKSRFSGAELFKKFVNICNELDYQDLTKTDTLKQLTGSDSIMVEKKFKNPFTFVNYAKLIFLTNELPRTTDKTNAFYRRVFLINFPYTFDRKTADRFLLNNITVNELEGLAFKSLSLLKGMMDRGFAFTNDEDTIEIMNSYERISNPFDTFIDEFYEEGVEGYVSKKEFKESFVKWLTMKGYRLWDDKAIKEAMKKRNIYEGRRAVDESRPFCWLGLSRKE